jgi:hypothetical protein
MNKRKQEKQEINKKKIEDALKGLKEDSFDEFIANSEKITQRCFRMSVSKRVLKNGPTNRMNISEEQCRLCQ